MWLLCQGLNQIMRHFAQHLPSFGFQELIDKFVGFCGSVQASPHLLYIQSFKLGPYSPEIWENRRSDQRNLKTSWECIFEYCSNCLVPERPNICAQWNQTCVVNWVFSGAHGAVKSHLCMAITEKVCLHVFAEWEHCFEWCQVKLWIEWELYTVPLRNQLVWSGSIACSRNR